MAPDGGLVQVCHPALMYFKTTAGARIKLDLLGIYSEMYSPFNPRQEFFSAQREVQLVAKVGAGSLGANQPGVLPTSDPASKATQTATQGIAHSTAGHKNIWRPLRTPPSVLAAKCQTFISSGQFWRSHSWRQRSFPDAGGSFRESREEVGEGSGQPRHARRE